MISTNIISLFLIVHDHTIVCNHNLRSIQDLMRSDKLDGTKFNHVCADYPNLLLINKSANFVEIRPLGGSSLGKLSPPPPLQDPLNIQQWCPRTPSAYSPDPVKRSAWSWKYYFVIPYATLFDQRSCRTGRLWTTSYSLHSLPRQFSGMDINQRQVPSRSLIPR